MHLDLIPKIITIGVRERIMKLKEDHFLIITSPSAIKIVRAVVPVINQELIFISSSRWDYIERLVMDAESRFHSNLTILGIGGGTVCDAAKLIARRTNSYLILIPTMLSTDAFLTDASGVRENGCVRYIKSKQADEVIIDFDLLMKAPKGFNAAGAGDVLSIFTGLFDWQLAHKTKGERFDELVYRKASDILQRAKSGRKQIAKESKEGLTLLLELLCLEVQLCNKFGNSRPEEGSEHFLAYSLENYVKGKFLHGEIVGLGIVIMSFLQGQDYGLINKIILESGINIANVDLKKTDLKKCLKSIGEYAVEHSLSYSIIDEIDDADMKIEKLITELNLKFR